MFRLISTTVSLAALLGFIAVGCGGSDSGGTTGGAGGTTTTAGTAAKGGSVSTGTTAVTGQGGATTATTTSKPPTGGTTTTAPTTPPLPKCGDGIANQDTEDCDGTDLRGATCDLAGAGATGTVSCDSQCKIDLTQCVTTSAEAGPDAYGDV
jgi:endo-1,4-beta-xylanase